MRRLRLDASTGSPDVAFPCRFDGFFRVLRLQRFDHQVRVFYSSEGEMDGHSEGERRLSKGPAQGVGRGTRVQFVE